MITAVNQVKVYGQVNPPDSLSYAGFVNGDGPLNLTKQPSATTMAKTLSPVGNYLITVGGAVDPNYMISYVAGDLRINPDATTATGSA